MEAVAEKNVDSRSSRRSYWLDITYALLIDRAFAYRIRHIVVYGVEGVVEFDIQVGVFSVRGFRPFVRWTRRVGWRSSVSCVFVFYVVPEKQRLPHRPTSY